MLDEPAKRGHKSMSGSLPCLFTMRDESAFGYMTKVTLLPWSTSRALRPGSRLGWLGLPEKLATVALANKMAHGLGALVQSKSLSPAIITTSDRSLMACT
jgi:DNA-binding transcriptional MocR family regulator